MFLFCHVFAMSLCASVYMCFVVTCWERADLLALAILDRRSWGLPSWTGSDVKNAKVTPILLQSSILLPASIWNI